MTKQTMFRAVMVFVGYVGMWVGGYFSGKTVELKRLTGERQVFLQQLREFGSQQREQLDGWRAIRKQLEALKSREHQAWLREQALEVREMQQEIL